MASEAIGAPRLTHDRVRTEDPVPEKADLGEAVAQIDHFLTLPGHPTPRENRLPFVRRMLFDIALATSLETLEVAHRFRSKVDA